MKWERNREDRRLWKAIDEMDAEMERLGVGDATEWDGFPEYERILYAIAEREINRRKAVRDEAAEREEIIGLAELAEESALSELAAFGSCQGWFFGSAEAPIVFETGFELWDDDRFEPSDEWPAWDAASEDIPGFFELNLSV